MNTVNDALLITSAPAEVVLGLGIYFCVVALALFALSMEAGHYRNLLRLFKCTVVNMHRRLLSHRRWLFIPRVDFTSYQGK